MENDDSLVRARTMVEILRLRVRERVELSQEEWRVIAYQAGCLERLARKKSKEQK